jgi:hypothetical protein
VRDANSAAAFIANTAQYCGLVMMQHKHGRVCAAWWCGVLFSLASEGCDGAATAASTFGSATMRGMPVHRGMAWTFHGVHVCKMITAPSMHSKQVSSRTRPLQAKLGMHAKLSVCDKCVVYS